MPTYLIGNFLVIQALSCLRYYPPPPPPPSPHQFNIFSRRLWALVNILVVVIRGGDGGGGGGGGDGGSGDR